MTAPRVPNEPDASTSRAVGLWKSLIPVGILLGWAALSPLAVYVVTRVQQANDPPDVCYGLGFGCVPDATTSALLFLLFLGGPVLAIVLIVIVIATVMGVSVRRRIWMAALLPPLTWIGIAAL